MLKKSVYASEMDSLVLNSYYFLIVESMTKLFVLSLCFCFKLVL